ncbi:putative dynein heavy chain 10, axonemal [Penaeus vannamei]|uniref:Putative dynein heavy chain 10, axonemal n=1 Tax=Penaeus vannamei TaxID=6689 RepID=A0A3R7NVP4_PENVA|nr:putative dynein heavy chain 10, axonemal [Penaeus vannamei]
MLVLFSFHLFSPSKSSAARAGTARDAGEEGEEEVEGGAASGGEEEQPRRHKSPRRLVLNNVQRLYDKYSQPVVGTSLGDLRQTWIARFMELSGQLAHVRAHPLVCEAEEAGEVAVGDGEAGGEDAGGEGATPSEGPASEGVEAKGSRKGSAKEVAVSKSTSKETAEAEEKENLRVAVKKSSELHGSISDCYRSLFYLEKFFHIVSEGNLETLSGHAAALLEILEIVWRVGRRDGISCRVQQILESAVQSLVNLVTKELRPVNLLPSGMREQLPFLESQSRVRRALQVVGEWEAATAKCADSVLHSAKRQRDGRQDFDPRKVLGTIASLKSVCEDLEDIMKVLLEAQVGSSGEWSALIRVQDPEQLKTITAQVLRVLTAYDFNIFSSRNHDRWIRQNDFQIRAEVGQAVVAAIHESFKDRMTSELVTAVAGVLAKQPCRTCFRQLLISRLPDLLSAFAAEVKGIRADFQAQQKIERPGTQAPLSGRVRWMTSYLTKRLAAWTTLKQLYSQYQVTC